MIVSRVRNFARWIAALLLLISPLAFGLCPVSRDARAMVAEPDREFVREAAASGSLEMKLSRIASFRANSDQIRQFALSLIEDHSKARRKLKEIAMSKNLKICDDLDENRARRLLTLQRYIGDEFDREYLTLQVDEHRRAVLLFQQQAQKGGSDELRNYAQSNLSMLESRLKLAQSLADSR